MRRFNFYLPDQQYDRLVSLSKQTGLPIAEITRRMYDCGFRTERLNETFPQLSGQIESVRQSS